MNKLIAAVAIGAVAILPIATLADAAAPNTGNVAISAQVNAACQVSNTSLAFGIYDPTATSPDNASNSFSVQCTKTTMYGVSVPASTSLTGASHGDSLAVSGIHTDVPAGNNSLADGTAQAHTLYGTIATGLFATPDSYSGSVTITATF